MKIIAKISEMIEDELEGAEEYVEEALKLKESHPNVAKLFYEISNQEMNHVNLLHGEVVSLINEYKKTDGEPPKAMQAIYDHIHERNIKKANKIKMYQAQFKENI